ncbi:hypothetical protein HDU91_002014 [Kappamyces sp. JEL0680]|nr:hypothetical protein HDU91_002014 [Kappamyces sp. JEL0680]
MQMTHTGAPCARVPKESEENIQTLADDLTQHGTLQRSENLVVSPRFAPSKELEKLHRIRGLEWKLNVGKDVAKEFVALDASDRKRLVAGEMTGPGAPKAGSGLLRNAKLYSKFTSNRGDCVELPQELARPTTELLSRWPSHNGIANLIDRCIIPPHADVAPVLRGANDKKYLRPLKARMFPIQFKTDRGTIFEQPHRVYLPALHLDPQNHKPVQELVPHPATAGSCGESPGFDSLALPDPDSERGIVPSYSSGWVVLIQNGRLEGNTGPYISLFEKICALGIQPAAMYLLDEICRFAASYSLPLVMVKCQVVIDKCLATIAYPIKPSVLMECIFNLDKVVSLMNKPGQRFKNGDEGRHYAAKTIQFYYSQYRTRCA